MTTGSIIIDNRYSTNTSCGSTNNAGFHSSEVWTGTDRSPGSFDNSEHTYNKRITYVNDDVFSWGWKSSGSGTPYTGTMLSCFGAPSQVLQWTDNDTLAAINKLGNKIRAHDFNLGNFVGEGRQTVALIADTATRVAKMLHYLRDGNLYKASQSFRRSKIKVASGHVLQKRYPKPFTAKEAADAVLELQYGWKPLYSDIHSSMQGLANLHHTPRVNRYKIVRKIIKRVLVENSSGISFKRDHVILRQYRATITSQPSFNTILHLNDPLSVAWEVMPWSFVVDWFLPIQSYLGAVDVTRNFDFGEVWYTEFDKRIDRFASEGSLVNIDECNFETGDISVIRNPASLDVQHLPVPSFKPFKDSLSSEHLVNAWALLTSSASRFKKSLKF